MVNTLKAFLLSILKLSISESTWLQFELCNFSSTIEVGIKIKKTVHTSKKEAAS